MSSSKSFVQSLRKMIREEVQLAVRDVIKEILVANKDMTDAKMSINNEGIMKLSFNNNNTKSSYFLIGKNDI